MLPDFRPSLPNKGVQLLELPLQKKNNYYPFLLATIPLLAIIFALLVGAILISFAGINPLKAYTFMLKGAFGNIYGFGETLTRFIPLLFCGLAFSFAFKAGIFNAGAEGQLYMGALGAVIVGVYIKGIPPFLHISLALILGFVFGALWFSIAGFLKIRFGSNELINTMMLNYLAILIIDLLLKGVLKDPAVIMDQSPLIKPTACLPYIFPGTRLHLGFILALAAVIVVYYLLWKTPLGYELRTLGVNFRAASYAGMDIIKGTIIGVIISGGLAGLGGAVELLGTQHRMMPGFSPGYGFDAIGAAVMGKNNPWGVVLTSFLFAVIRVGAGAMQRGLGVPLPLLAVIQGMIIIFVISSSYFSQKLSATVIGGRA